jgi:hypothetical protein
MGVSIDLPPVVVPSFQLGWGSFDVEPLLSECRAISPSSPWPPECLEQRESALPESSA